MCPARASYGNLSDAALARILRAYHLGHNGIYRGKTQRYSIIQSNGNGRYLAFVRGRRACILLGSLVRDLRYPWAEKVKRVFLIQAKQYISFVIHCNKTLPFKVGEGLAPPVFYAKPFVIGRTQGPPLPCMAIIICSAAMVK